MESPLPGSGILKLKASMFWAALLSQKALVDLNLAVCKWVPKGPVFQWQVRVMSLSTLVMWWWCCVEILRLLSDSAVERLEGLEP